jgi:hypothetical protein
VAGVLCAIAAGLSGCASLAMTAAGIGASTAVNHTLTGVSYRTFTVPLPKVKTASLSALGRMGMKVGVTEKREGSEFVNAVARDRQITIELEPLTANTTRMRVAARNGGVFYDRATSNEIIQQTEKVLGLAT